MAPNPFMAVIAACNKFDDNWENMWKFKILDNSSPVGYIPNYFFEDLEWKGTAFIINKDTKTVHLDTDPRPKPEARGPFCVKQFTLLCENNRTKFNGVLEQWLESRSCFSGIRWLDNRDEVIPIPSPLRGILGVTTAGVHLNVFTTLEDGQPAMWVSRRSMKTNYAGMLDQITAGCVRPFEGYKPWEALKREALDEAGLLFDPETKAMTTTDGLPIGTVQGPSGISFYDKKAEHVVDEIGHIEPGYRWVFEMDVPPDCIFTPNDDYCIHEFFRMSVDDVKKSLLAGKWKPNSGLTTLDSLVRRGHVEDANDELRNGLQAWPQVREKMAELSEAQGHDTQQHLGGFLCTFMD